MDQARSQSRRVPTWMVIAFGIVVGALLGLGAAALAGSDDDTPHSLELSRTESLYPADQAANVDEFLASWTRYRTATFKAELTFSRTLASGQKLNTNRTVVQQPPQRAIRQAGSVTTIDDDESVVCEPVGGDTVCTQQPSLSFEAAVAMEVAAWRTAIGGDEPLYALTVSSEGCFELERVRIVTDPPYGDATQVCFDAATGAMRSREVISATSNETEQATSISATVTEADWQAIRQ